MRRRLTPPRPQYIVGVTTPIGQDLLGWRLYVLYSFFVMASFVGVWFFYPETAGVGGFMLG